MSSTRAKLNYRQTKAQFHTEQRRRARPADPLDEYPALRPYLTAPITADTSVARPVIATPRLRTLGGTAPVLATAERNVVGGAGLAR